MKSAVLANGFKVISGGFRCHPEYLDKVVRVDYCEIVIVHKCTGGMVLDRDNRLFGKYVYHVTGNVQGRIQTLDATNLEVLS